jgi:hypothetical protein
MAANARMGRVVVGLQTGFPLAAALLAIGLLLLYPWAAKAPDLVSSSSKKRL